MKTRFNYQFIILFIVFLGTTMGLTTCKKENTPPTPTITTNKITIFNSFSAAVGGSVTSNGGPTELECGVYYGTLPNPETTGTKFLISKRSRNFSDNLTGLKPNTLYYIKAYATNSTGTAYGTQQTFTTPITYATISTNSVSSITSSTATCGGDISSDGGSAITARGVCWSTSTTPTVSLSTKTLDGTGSGSFSSNLTGLQANTIYYVSAYATNALGTVYGVQQTFTTSNASPSLTTSVVISVTTTTASCGGNITSDGGSAVTARGICWSTTANPTIALSTKTTDGTGAGSYSSSLTGLQPGTTYYVRAYATNANGTVYGASQNFTTDISYALITTNDVTSITSNSVICGGNITSDGGSAVTDRGLCWSTSTNPTVSLTTKTSGGTGTGSFSSSLTGLQAGTTYYIRAYATNANGTVYGTQQTFTTGIVNSTVIITTSVVSNITSSTATCGGNITSDGGSAITARGVCWSITQNPTIAYYKTTDGTGINSFTSTLTGLASGTTYYVRAYATNSSGTSYGNQLTISTLAALPEIATASVSAITSTTAISGGNITSDGGNAITEKGVCWSTTINPTISNFKTSDGNGIVSFSSVIIGLNPTTLYYVRAYASNSVGTTYGEQLSFTTLNSGPFVCGNYLAISHSTTGGVAPVSKTVNYGTVKTTLSGAGKCWITQNLGADHQATSATDGTEASGGWYWQFNRKQGYSVISNTTSPTWTIASINESSDWLPSTDPCSIELGAGWRIPTSTEWSNTLTNGDPIVFNTVLKIHCAGSIYDGVLYGRGSKDGDYWSSTQFDASSGWDLLIGSLYGNVYSRSKDSGHPLRCIKD